MVSLIFGAIVLSIALLEILLSTTKIFENNYNRISTQAPLHFTIGPPFTLIQKTILYISSPQKNQLNFGHWTFINKMGFRERNFDLKKPKGVFRILVFGDSLTFGVGVNKDHRYTELLETMLNLGKENSPESYVTGIDRMLNDKQYIKKFEVINFGMPGYEADQERELMESVLKIVECDLVIVGFCCNDLNMTTKTSLKAAGLADEGGGRYSLNIDGKMTEIYKGQGKSYSTIPLEEPKDFFQETHWYHGLKIFQFLEARSNVNVEVKLPTSARWKYFSRQYQGMMALTKQYRLPPPVVPLLLYGNVDPHQNNFEHPKGELSQLIRLYDFVGGRLKEQGFYVVNTLPLFKKYSGQSLAVSEWEWHPNYLGHYIYAKSIFEFLISNHLIPLH